MSKPLDYSKWDNIDLSSDETEDEDEDVHRNHNVSSVTSGSISSDASSTIFDKHTYGKVSFTNDSNRWNGNGKNGCKHVITVADTTVEDLNIVQNVFELMANDYNTMAINVNKIGIKKATQSAMDVISGKTDNMSVMPKSNFGQYFKHIHGNEVREKPLNSICSVKQRTKHWKK